MGCNKTAARSEVLTVVRLGARLAERLKGLRVTARVVHADMGCNMMMVYMLAAVCKAAHLAVRMMELMVVYSAEVQPKGRHTPR